VRNSHDLKAVILAAGLGSRVRHALPKCLLTLPNGETILGRQINILKKFAKEIVVVVGFKKELIMENFPEVLYKYNPVYASTNTARSLLCGIEHIENDDVLWLNGDVVFDESVIPRLLECEYPCVAVNRSSKVGAEEVKYTLDEAGFIKEISKTLKNGLGEAVGINLIKGYALETFKNNLQKCSNRDYFEKAIELCIKDGVKFKPVDISDALCIEVDFIEDLRRVFKRWESTL